MLVQLVTAAYNARPYSHPNSFLVSIQSAVLSRLQP